MLKHHANPFGPQFPQRLGRQRQHILPQNPDIARSRLDQPVYVAQQGEFTTARQAHDAENLVLLHRDRRISNADDAFVPHEDFGLGCAPFASANATFSADPKIFQTPDISITGSVMPTFPHIHRASGIATRRNAR
jgi:hypothetical protein